MATMMGTIVAPVLAAMLLLLLITTAAAEPCDSRFRGRCTCGIGPYEGRSRYIVNCTNADFTDTSVLEYMPALTEVLIFTGNRIGELPPNVIGTINDYPLLSVIDMSNNHIREIRGKAYHHVASVELLILNHNNLSIDDDEQNRHHPRVFSNFFNLQSLHLTNAFAENTSPKLSRNLHDIFKSSNLTKLVKLHLEQNEIQKFADPDVFCELRALRELYLADNELSTMQFNVGCLRNLHFLNLERNRFAQLQYKELAQLERLQAMPGRTDELLVDLNLNPFVCDCKLQPFVTWMGRTNVSLRNREQLTCRHRRDRVFDARGAAGRRSASGSGADDLLSGAAENLLDYDEPLCQLNTAHAGAGHVVALAVLLGAFSALLLVLIVAVVYMSRERIRLWCRPMLSTVSKKVQYTTIRNEDQCPEVHV